MDDELMDDLRSFVRRAERLQGESDRLFKAAKHFCERAFEAEKDVDDTRARWFAERKEADKLVDALVRIRPALVAARMFTNDQWDTALQVLDEALGEPRPFPLRPGDPGVGGTLD